MYISSNVLRCSTVMPSGRSSLSSTCTVPRSRTTADASPRNCWCCSCSADGSRDAFWPPTCAPSPLPLQQHPTMPGTVDFRPLNSFKRIILLAHFTEFHWGGGSGHWLVQMEWRPAGWSVCLPLLIFLFIIFVWWSVCSSRFWTSETVRPISPRRHWNTETILMPLDRGRFCSCVPVFNLLRLLPISDNTKCWSPINGKNGVFHHQRATE